MIKGIDSTLKPFLEKIIIEDGYQSKIDNSSEIDLYYDNSSTSSQNKSYQMQISMDFCIKSVIEQALEINQINALKNSLTVSSLQVLSIGNKQSFINFISSNQEQKINYLNKFRVSTPGGKMFLNGIDLFFAKDSLNKYLSTIDSDTIAEAKQRLLSVPIQVRKNFSKDLTTDNKSPNFLAYIYFLTAGSKVIITDSINSEIIFDNAALVKKTGYFVISKTYRFKGQELELTKTPVLSNKNMIDPFTGESVNPNNQLTSNQRVNYLFGAPGDIWVGPTHFHPITDPTDVNFGKSRIMAASQHNSTIPHPFLDYVIKGNDKIIDFRSIGSFEDLFSYKSSMFEKVLAESSEVLYTGQKSNFYIDDFITNKSIVSESKFSIRPISRQGKPSQQSSIKDNVILFFSIDKKKLIKNTTKAPILLEKLTAINPDFYSQLTDDIDIFHFEIIRINKKTKMSKTLLVAPNDISYNDYKAKNQLGQNISQGFSFVNQTNNINLQNDTTDSKINFYEFTDGELDAYADNNTYCYEIRLKFKDPLIEYITNKLNQLNEIIQNLNELFLKTGFVIKDNNSGQFVSVYDRFQKRLNPTFVSQALNPPSAPSLPLGFSFDNDSEIPLSVKVALDGGASLDNLSTYIFAIKLFSVDNTLTLDVLFELEEIQALKDYIRSSLRLSNTNPTLIDKVRSLMELIRDRTEKLLSLYSTEQIVKKSSNFTTKDYLKSTGNTKNSETYVTEFNYVFKEKIDLSKVKNNFNWIEESNHVGETGGLKKITQSSYKFLVKNPNITNELTEEGNIDFGKESDFSYSFLPYVAPSTLELHKTNQISVYLNYLQTIRKSLIHNITNTPDSVLIPEILATFGIKFNVSIANSKLLEYIGDKLAYDKSQVPVNNPSEDNFGSNFSQQPKPVSGFQNYSFSDIKAPTFGSVEDPDYAWQGSDYNNYPINFGLSLINLINTNMYHRRDISFLNETYLDLINDNVIIDSEINTANKNVPYSINLFSSAVMSNKNTALSILPTVTNVLFSGDQLRFNLYHYYSYLLNIFGKVHYLRGFKQREDNAFGGNFGKFFNTTRENNQFVKDMDWQPLTLEIINNIPTNKQVLCKIDLFEGDAIFNLLDEKIINLYKDYSNYNELFFINGPQIDLLEPVTEIGPTEVPKVSLGPETRKQVFTINREFVETLRTQDQTERETVNSTVDDTSTKITIAESGSPRLTFTKPRR